MLSAPALPALGGIRLYLEIAGTGGLLGVLFVLAVTTALLSGARSARSRGRVVIGA